MRKFVHEMLASLGLFYPIMYMIYRETAQVMHTTRMAGEGLLGAVSGVVGTGVVVMVVGLGL